MLIVQFAYEREAQIALMTHKASDVQTIFNFHCDGNCGNCGLPKRSCPNGTPLTSIDAIPEETVEGGSCRIEAVGSFWNEQKRGRKKYLHTGRSSDRKNDAKKDRQKRQNERNNERKADRKKERKKDRQTCRVN